MSKTTAKTPKKRKLTLKQQKFINNYLETGNGKQSMIEAGYSEKGAKQEASKILTNPDHTVTKEIKSAADKLGINTEYVLNNFKKVIEVNSKTYNKTIGIGNSEDLPSIEEMVDASAVIKSNELLGKHLKLFTDKVELDGKLETNEKPDLPLLARKIAFILSKAKK